MSFIFGPDMIKEPILSNLPQVKMNLHLGLSPWYKGSATLFWPFYFLQPQYAGITLHNISEKPDQGDIFHQSTPKLSLGDGIHDVAAKAVIQAREDVIKMVLKFNKNGQLKFTQQRTTGRVWRTIDFQPAHLRVIYNLFNNDIVDYYLNGVFPEDLPKLISRLEDE